MLLQSRERVAVSNAVCGIVHSSQQDAGNKADNEEICCSRDRIIRAINVRTLIAIKIFVDRKSRPGKAWPRWH